MVLAINGRPTTADSSAAQLLLVGVAGSEVELQLRRPGEGEGDSELVLKYIYFFHTSPHYLIDCGNRCGVATICRLLKIIGLFCKRAL